MQTKQEIIDRNENHSKKKTIKVNARQEIKMQYTLETLPNISEFIKKQINFDILQKDAGIYETDFIGDSDFTIGISYENNDAGDAAYVYNVFAGKEWTKNNKLFGGEYINIPQTGNEKDPLPKTVIDEIAKILTTTEYEKH